MRKILVKEDIHEFKCVAVCFGIQMKNLTVDQDEKIIRKIRSLSRHVGGAEVLVVDCSGDIEISED